MQLSLSNVGIHKSLDLEFPETGLVLIQGKSGKGKSTILQAIEDVFFGSIKELKPRDFNGLTEISLKTVINGQNSSLYRTKNPDTFNLVVGDNTYKDDEAESMIEKLLWNYEEFCASTYIMQNGEGSLLTLGPSDMERFINNLVFKTENPDLYKEAISKKIGEYKQLVSASSSRVEMLTSQFNASSLELESFRVKLEEKTKEIEGLDSKTISDEITKNKVNLCFYSKESKTLFDEAGSIDKEINSPIYSKVEKLKVLESDLELYEKKCIDDIKKIDEYLTNNPNPYNKKPKDVLLKEIEDIKNKSKYLKIKAEIFKLAEEIRQKQPDVLEFKGKMGEYLEVKAKETQESIDSVNKSISSLDQELSSAKLSKENKKCPHCDGALKIKKGDIVKAECCLVSDSEILEIINKIENLRLDIKKFNDKREWFIATINKASTLKSQLGEDPAPWCQESDMISLMNTKVEEFNNNESIVGVRNQQFTIKGNIEKTLQEKRKSVDKVRDEVKGLVLPNKEELIAKKEEILKNYQLLKEKISETNANLNDLSEKQRILDSYWNIQERHADCVKSNNELSDELKRSEDILARAKSALGRSERLKELQQVASSLSLEEKIEEINNRAAKYIDQMFSDDGTVVRISNFTQIKKGKEEKAKLSLDIFHKGHKVSNFKKGLSGGERSRITLAFQLGLSELYCSPILMIDEGFKGLEIEDMTTCIEALKEFSDQKLVIVVEHNVPVSYFDKVVTL